MVFLSAHDTRSSFRTAVVKFNSKYKENPIEATERSPHFGGVLSDEGFQ